MNEGYTTPEGLWLSRRLLLPDVREFAEVLEYLGEWELVENENPPPRVIGNETGARRRGNAIGPFCLTRNLGVYRSMAVRATDLTIEAVQNQLVTPDDTLSFELILHEDRNRVLVVLSHGYIIGSHWVAYIDPASIPPYPFAHRDERFRQICGALKDGGMEPFVKREGGDIEVRAITGRTRDYQNIFHPKLRAVIHQDGGITRTWADGTVTEEPA